MKILVFLLPAVFAKWSKPKYYDIISESSSRSANTDWGHPVEGRKAAHYTKCPEMSNPPGAVGVKCNRATCAVVCPGGSRAIGQRRTRCRFNRSNGKYYWSFLW